MRMIGIGGWRLLAGFEGDRGDAGRDVQADPASDAERLQSHLLRAAAEQHIGAETEADRRLSGDAAVMAGKRTLADLARREHRPDDPALGREADIDAVFVDLAVIALGLAIGVLEDAV